MNKNLLPLLKSSALSGALLLLPATFLAGQTILFQDDFSTSENNGEPSMAIWGSSVRNAAEGKTIKVSTENSELYFGSPGNGYLHLRQLNSTSGSLFIEANDQFTTPSTVITLAFDFHIPSITSWGAANNFNDPRFRFGIEEAFGKNNNRISNQLQFSTKNNGFGTNTGLYSKDTTHSIAVVLNNSTETVSYGSGNQVASSRYDVWIDGTLALQGAGADSTFISVGTPLTTIGFGSFAGGSEMFIDNLIVYEGAYLIPEPSTYALIAGVLMLPAICFLRRKQATA